MDDKKLAVLRRRVDSLEATLKVALEVCYSTRKELGDVYPSAPRRGSRNSKLIEQVLTKRKINVQKSINKKATESPMA